MNSRVILIVLDSLGIGELPDAAEYGDSGSNTLRAVWTSGELDIPTLTSMGLFNIDKNNYARFAEKPTASFARLAEASKGKDTTIGHWEIAGLISTKPFPTYIDGFPPALIESFKTAINKDILCNRPYSGTTVLNNYGEEHLKTGSLIVYTSADSVFQIAAHEALVPVDELYGYCKIARGLLMGKHAVGRVIARPFVGERPGEFVRTANRHDFSLEPHGETICDILAEHKINTVGVGKISDIFAGRGIQKSYKTKDNTDGMNRTIQQVREGESGFIFTNLVDFDMKYGHRNDPIGYAQALNHFDRQLETLLDCMQEKDILMITADHGCDPATASTDHSREYVPLLIAGKSIQAGVNLGTRTSFSDIAASTAEIFAVTKPAWGTSFYSKVRIH